MDSKRDSLNLIDMAKPFIDGCREDDPGLYKSLLSLDDSGQRELGGVAGRFAPSPARVAEPRVRLRVRRLVGRLRKPDTRMLSVLNRILDYMDFNADARLEDAEMEVCLELVERFSGVVSRNDSLSAIELDLLYAVLRFHDVNLNGRLEAEERESLLKAIEGGRSFLRLQFEKNPDFRKIAQENHLVF